MYYSKKIKDSSQAANLMRGHLGDLDHEELWALFLTSANTLIEAEMLTKGTLSATLIDSRTVVKRALMNNAASVQSWLKALKNDNRMIVWASAKAEQAARYILGDTLQEAAGD